MCVAGGCKSEPTSPVTCDLNALPAQQDFNPNAVGIYINKKYSSIIVSNLIEILIRARNILPICSFITLYKSILNIFSLSTVLIYGGTLLRCI